MERTYVVTGAASGIGAATARYLRERGGRVIGSDLRDAEVIADLVTAEGRAALVDGVKRLSGGKIDAILAIAGGAAEYTPSLNFFGAVATLDGLRPLLQGSPAPRAVAVSSIGSLMPGDQGLAEICLRMDEVAVIAAARDALAAGRTILDLYQCAKYALNCWCRRAAATPQWAGEGITLNVIAPGFIDTPAAAYILSNPDLREAMGQMVPMRGAYPGRADELAAILAWCVSPENSLMTGQILFVDGGYECSQRGEATW